MSGYFRIYRKLFYSDVWMNTSTEQHEVLLNLLNMASWLQHEKKLNSGRIIHLKPGQFVTSVAEIESACNIGGMKRVTAKQIRLALSKFEELGFLKSKKAGLSDKDGTLVEIRKWRTYQHFDDGKENKNQGQVKGQVKGQEGFSEKGKKKNSENPCTDLSSEDNSVEKGKKILEANGKQKGNKKGKSTYINKKGIKEGLYNNPDTANADVLKTPVFLEGLSEDVSNCLDYFQEKLHPFYSLEEAEAVKTLAEEYSEDKFKFAADKTSEKRVNNSGTWKYMDKILKNSNPTNLNTKPKNDIVGSVKETMRILESGELIDL